MPWTKELQLGMQGIPPKPRPAYATKGNIFTSPSEYEGHITDKEFESNL